MKNEDLPSIVRKSTNIVELQFDPKIYPAIAVKKAAYKFARHFAALLSTSSDEDFKASLIFNDKIEEAEQEKVVCAFLNEVIDQDLREQIRCQTEGTRTLILAEAFSRTSLLNSES